MFVFRFVLVIVFYALLCSDSLLARNRVSFIAKITVIILGVLLVGLHHVLVFASGLFSQLVTSVCVNVTVFAII